MLMGVVAIYVFFSLGAVAKCFVLSLLPNTLVSGLVGALASLAMIIGAWML